MPRPRKSRRPTAGVADISDPALKDRVAYLAATRDQARADATRAQAMPESSGAKAITPGYDPHLRQGRAAAHACGRRRISPRSHAALGSARRSSRRRSSYYRIEVPAASDAHRERQRKHGAQSRTEMAEREGFEPSIRFWRILTFQASAFDHSATAPHALEEGRALAAWRGFRKGAGGGMVWVCCLCPDPSPVPVFRCLRWRS